MTPHTHYPTPAHAARLLTAVADHVARRSLDGRVYRFQNQAVEIVRRTQTELVIATLDRAQTLRYRTGMVCMMTVPIQALVGAAPVPSLQRRRGCQGRPACQA